MARGKIHEKDETSFLDIFQQFKNNTGKEVGAIGSFVGIVRETGKKGGVVDRLSYENAAEASNQLEKIAKEVEEKTEGVSEVEIHHIVDELEPTDEIMYVLVAGAHRKEVFEALPKTVDRVKSEVQIWKKEVTDDDSYWVHEVDND